MDKKRSKKGKEKKTVSQAEFRKLCGISESSTRRYIASESIAVDRTKRPYRILIDHPVTQKFLSERRVLPSDEESRVVDYILDNVDKITISDLKNIPLSALKKAKAIAEIKRETTKYNAQSGKLIPRKKVDQFMMELVAFDKTTICSLGAVLSPEINNILKSAGSQKEAKAKVKKLISKEIDKALRMKHQKIKTFLETV